MISIAEVQNLQQMVGKVCTILTPYSNASVDSENKSDKPTTSNLSLYYSVKITSITQDCIWGKSIYDSGLTHVFFFPILGIVEEKVVDVSSTEYKKIQKAIEKPKPVSNDVFVNLEGLNEQVDLAKQAFKE